MEAAARNARTGDALAVGAAAASAAAYLVASEAVKVMGPLMLGTLEFLVALPIAVIWAAASGSHRAVGRLGARHLALLALQALLTFAAIGTLWVALQLVPPTTAAILGRLEVVLAVIAGSLLLGDRSGPLQLAGGAISFGGVLVMRWQATPELRAGTLLVLASALGFALAEVVASTLARDVPSSLFLLLRTPMLTVVFAVALLGDAVRTGHAPAFPGTRGLLLAAALALCGPLLARAFYYGALRRTSLSRAALLNQTQPLIVALLALVATGAVPGPREVAGGLLVVGGTVLLLLAHGPVPGVSDGT